jgi:hypothetical protein
MSVSIEEVIGFYRLLLGREPESAQVMQEHAALKDRRELARVLLSSDEFAKRSLSDIGHGGQLGGHIPNEIYPGYEPEDAARVAALIVAPPQAAAGFYVDCFGQRFDPAYQQAIANRVGLVSQQPPFPDDGHLSEGVEYAAAALAFEAARGRRRFAAAELGAGWGPWTTFFALTARALGFKDISVAAIEADAGRFTQMRGHLANNDVVAKTAADQGQSDGLRWKLYNAAAWWCNETLLWPDTGDAQDSGMRAESTADSSETDYRGFKTGFREIPAIDIAEALADLGPFDILHIDIQGSEIDLIPNSIEFLEAQVRSMFVGTHSRKIEGDLMSFLFARGWQLLREKPCKFLCDSAAPTLPGRTTVDGGQYWLNPRLRDAA